MPSNFITTVFGPDIPGVIKSIADVTRGNGGSWLTSKVIRLDGQFAAIMNVVVAADREQALKDMLRERFPALQFVYSAAENSPTELKKTIKLVVDCIDRPGLTGDLTNILMNLGIGIEDMDCRRFAMEGINDTVFSARLTLAVPEDADSEVIAGEIEVLSEEVRVNVV